MEYMSLLYADRDLWLKLFSVRMYVKINTNVNFICNYIVPGVFKLHYMVPFFCAMSSSETVQLCILVLYQLVWNFQYILYNLLKNTATSLMS